MTVGVRAVMTSGPEGRTDWKGHGGGFWAVGSVPHPDPGGGYARVCLCKNCSGFAFRCIHHIRHTL